MSVWEIIVIGIGLSMDAFAVSVCKGLSVRKAKPKHCLIAGAYFGGFQAAMPLIGWLLGRQFESLIKSFDHWIAFGLLTLIGANIIREALGGGEKQDGSFSPKTMIPLAVATSIDALAVGVTFAFLDVAIVPSVLCIGATTFVLSAVGIKAGGFLGERFQTKAEIAGGIVLILMGIKILIEHLLN